MCRVSLNSSPIKGRSLSQKPKRDCSSTKLGSCRGTVCHHCLQEDVIQRRRRSTMTVKDTECLEETGTRWQQTVEGYGRRLSVVYNTTRSLCGCSMAAETALMSREHLQRRKLSTWKYLVSSCCDQTTVLCSSFHAVANLYSNWRTTRQVSSTSYLNRTGRKSAAV